MKLHAALGASLLYTRGDVPEISEALASALEIAESLDDAELQLRAHWGLWSLYTARGRHRLAVAHAERFRALAAARSDPNDRPVGERLIGFSRHYLGDLASARKHLERMLADYVVPTRRSGSSRGFCGCRVFLIRRCKQPKPASRTFE